MADHVPWVEPSPSPGNGRRRATTGYRARCSCGWVSSNKAKKTQAQEAGIGHVREEARKVPRN